MTTKVTITAADINPDHPHDIVIDSVGDSVGVLKRYRLKDGEAVTLNFCSTRTLVLHEVDKGVLDHTDSIEQVILAHKELQEKISVLEDFLRSPKIAQLPSSDKGTLMDQVESMQDDLRIAYQRIRFFTSNA